MQQLVFCVDHHHREKAALDLLSRKLTSIPNMDSAELKEFLPEGSSSSGSVAENRSLAAQHLTLRVKLKHEELGYCSFLIENCLYLVWCHLDYYMLRALSRIQSIPPIIINRESESQHQEVLWNVTAQEISQLKQGLVSIFNDSFSRKLIDTKQDHPATDKGFVEALLRKIKRLQFVPVK